MPFEKFETFENVVRCTFGMVGVQRLYHFIRIKEVKTGGSITRQLFSPKYNILMPPSERSSKWSVTINLKTVSKETAESCISHARQIGWTVLGQLEEGEVGTEHFQLAVATPQLRFSAIKKVFPTAHIEVCRDWTALIKYCQKTETRKEKLIEMKFVTFQMVRDKFFDFLNTTTYADLTYELTDETKTSLWDRFIGHSLENGIECDLVGVNPQYRSCIMKYWSSYLVLSLHRQTDRQTQETLVPSINIPTTEDGLSQANDEEEDGRSSSSEWSSDGSSSPF